MKKLLLITIVGLMSICMIAAQKSIPKPNPPRLVVDNAQALTAEEVNALEHKLDALDDSTSNQIAVVLVSSLNDQPIEDVAVNTFREWGIGDKKKNNGVLVLVAVNDHKMRIEVGYGLEGAIPDITANDIIDNDMKPAFRQNQFFAGLMKATDDIGKAAAGEYHEQSTHQKPRKGGGGLLKFIMLIVFVIIIMSMRGGRGGGGGGLLLLPLMFGGGGGGNWGGSDSGDGGGFGGFGGGSSGGGGASGSW